MRREVSRRKVYLVFGARESKQTLRTQARSAIATREAKNEEEAIRGRNRACQCHSTRWTPSANAGGGDGRAGVALVWI